MGKHCRARRLRRGILSAVLLCLSVLHKEIPRRLAYTHPHFNKILHGIWPDHPVFQDEQHWQLLSKERMASVLGLCPLYPWEAVQPLLDRAVKELHPRATTSLEGSHSDGTAVQGISDYDVWVDTGESISKGERKMLFEHILQALQDAGFRATSRDNGIGRKAMKFQISEVDSDNPPINLDAR
eukprot:Skav203641  [mRNA]  locus=scaffold1120:284501:286217:+ [translate_table: standard]